MLISILMGVVFTLSANSYENAILHIDKEKKPCILIFVGQGCGACERLKKGVVTPLLPLLRKLFIVHFIDINEEVEVTKLFRRTMQWSGSIPYTCLIDKNKKITKGDIGYKSIEEFINFIEE